MGRLISQGLTVVERREFYLHLESSSANRGWAAE